MSTSHFDPRDCQTFVLNLLSNFPQFLTGKEVNGSDLIAWVANEGLPRLMPATCDYYGTMFFCDERVVVRVWKHQDNHYSCLIECLSRDGGRRLHTAVEDRVTKIYDAYGALAPFAYFVENYSLPAGFVGLTNEVLAFLKHESTPEHTLSKK